VALKLLRVASGRSDASWMEATKSCDAGVLAGKNVLDSEAGAALHSVGFAGQQADMLTHAWCCAPVICP
jgi:hypothetical protein